MKLIFTQGPSITTRVLVAAVVSLAFMVIDHRQHHLESVRSVLSVVLSPLIYIADMPVAASLWLGESISSRQHLQSENQRLIHENLLLQAKQQKMATLEAENIRLREMLESSFNIGERVLIAELLAVDLDPYRHQVLINKGDNSGVFEGQPVLDADAVMGQIIHTNTFTSTVLMITDASHALPVRVNRNGLRTIAQGTGRLDELELTNLPNNADIQVGDLLVTSGLGGRFPAGYPVAMITQVTHEPGQPFSQVTAKPQAHLERTREVLLVWPLTPPVVDEQTAPDQPTTDSEVQQ
ncbi:MAG: rod shape-determining protein MreC [Gammaproteobacteria bacterium]|nr:rod shape-determining protein MreC [Gammaproteobacteria bacterium]